MKIRIGFVSNSSSSSFIAVVSDFSLEKILKQIDRDFNDEGIGHGQESLGNGLTLYDNDGEYLPGSIGMDIDQHLRSGYTVPQAKKIFQKLVLKEYGINIPLKLINFAYGRVGSG